MKTVPRFVAPLTSLALALATVLIPAAPAAAQVRAYATVAHPYSDPVWYPLAGYSEMGCMQDSPGCPPAEIQPEWSWDIQGKSGANHEKVYAMGAGIVHILTQNQGCGGSEESRGNSLYIDHGAGVISMYSHLASGYLVQDGDYVSARTPIAYVGNSGYKLCHQKPDARFLAVVVKHDSRRAPNGGMTGTYMQVRQTYACVHGRKVEWPQQLPARQQGWARWHNVPLNTPIHTSSAQRSCIPAPATARMPQDASLRRGSQTGLAATWTAPAAHFGVSTVRVMLQAYHPSITKWMPLCTHTPDGTATRTYFPHLDVHYKYRVKVWFANHVGWSRASHWQLKGFPH
jgi:hypothetical protein